jgi:hypothetical protein
MVSVYRHLIPFFLGHGKAEHHGGKPVMKQNF